MQATKEGGSVCVAGDACKGNAPKIRATSRRKWQAKTDIHVTNYSWCNVAQYSMALAQ